MGILSFSNEKKNKTSVRFVCNSLNISLMKGARRLCFCLAENRNQKDFDSFNKKVVLLLRGCD